MRPSPLPSVDRRRRPPASRRWSAPAVDVQSATSTCYTSTRDSTGTRPVYAVPSAAKHSTRPVRASSATVDHTASPTTAGPWFRRHLTLLRAPAINNMKLLHWQLIGGLLHLVQRGGDWVGPQPAQTPPCCTKCNRPPVNGQCTNHRIAV